MTNVLYAIYHIIESNISSIKEYKALNYKFYEVILWA